SASATVLYFHFFTSLPAHLVLINNGKRTWFAVLEGSSNLGLARAPSSSNRTEGKQCAVKEKMRRRDTRKIAVGRGGTGLAFMLFDV
ncbi:MAG: hypothetical protein ACRCVV_15405, partial [Shewanella sp.]